MIDAILHAVLDDLRTQGGYAVDTCDVRPSGKPVPRCGDVYVAVHEGGVRSTNDNCLMEYFAWRLTITMRVTVPLDRVGDQLLARKLAKEVGFNRRAEALRDRYHMAWGLLSAANTYLVNLGSAQTTVVYGFCEPARYRGRDEARLVGPEWFDAEEGEDVGLVSELRFEDCRRMQPMGRFA